ncbi:MAG: T9SS type A sorting domain-containing protein [Weeksellaceae bacterium]|nr:T9SS type A sorting domain-containing protein [Weeksellaceae bacterium]
MKRNLFFMLAIAAFSMASAQEFISFEQSEGYVTGDINGQNGWTVTGAGEGVFITNQVITDNFSTHGSWSFQNNHEEEFPPQQSVNVGATYTLSTPLNPTEFVIEYDIHIPTATPSPEGMTSDYVFWVLNEEGQFIQAIYMFSQGNVYAIGYNEQGAAAWVNQQVEFEFDTTYEFRLEGMGENIGLSINEESIALLPIMNQGNIARIAMRNNNHAGFAYYDNIRINAHLSTNDVAGAVRGSVVYPNPVKDVLNVRLAEGFEVAKTSVNVLNTAGQRVAAFKNVSGINLSRLTPGVYIVEITDGVNTETKKIIKR